jgi:hypothetical protein
MRRSISRTFSRYCVIVWRSDAPSWQLQAGRFLGDRVEDCCGLPGCAPRAAPPCHPRRTCRSNTLRGLISIGCGVVGVRHDSVFM